MELEGRYTLELGRVYTDSWAPPNLAVNRPIQFSFTCPWASGWPKLGSMSHLSGSHLPLKVPLRRFFGDLQTRSQYILAELDEIHAQNR